MTANNQFQTVRENPGLRGFANLFKKENQAWWKTRRWWINLILWAGMLGGLVSLMLFVLPSIATAANDPAVAEAGGPLPFSLIMGRSVFFELGSMAIAIGVIILCQDLIIDEKQSGVAEWILSKPVARRSYVLAKLAANGLAVLLLLLTVPALAAYGLLSARAGEPFPLTAFLAGIGIMSLHTLFYLTLTILAGTLFNNRGGILALALGVLFSGALLGGFLGPLTYVTPWNLAKIAGLVAGGEALPIRIVLYPLLSTALWSILFTILSLWKFERAEF
jgi:ABC-2 type transport system permease protein